VAVTAPDPAITQSASAAQVDAARFEGRPISVTTTAHGAAARVSVSESADGGGAVAFEGAVPLSASGRALVARTVERDALARRVGTAPAWRIADSGARRAAAPAFAAGAAARFGLVMMLWLTLTGSLGMLLNAVVRERANRALEMLLGAARPADIVFGKLVGVGAVSLLVLSVWLGAAALAPLAPGASGPAAAVLASLGDPAALARAGVIYVMGYAFYGLLTIAIGAAARDSAQAQNLSRPMFAVLLAAFFASLASVAGAASRLQWLVWAPPFTPFILLLEPPNAVSPAHLAIALGILAASAALCAVVAMRRLGLGPRPTAVGLRAQQSMQI
jgi:ABC-2 type transport system permease protein